MEILIAACILLALMIGLAALGVLKEYNVEFTFHPSLRKDKAREESTAVRQQD
jgi:hypothetical protein